MEAATIPMRVISSSFICNPPYPKSSHLFNPKSASRPIVGCIHSQRPHPNSWYALNPISRTSFSCSAVTSRHLDTSGTNSPIAAAESDALVKLQLLIKEFQLLSEPVDRVKKLLQYAELLPPFEDSLKTSYNRVPGCTAQVWLHVQLNDNNKFRFLADSDSELTKGFCACLVWMLDDATPEEVLALKTEDLEALSLVGLNRRLGDYSSNRANTWHNVLITMQKRAKTLMAEVEGRPCTEQFPSLIVTAEGIRAKGSYAEAQVELLLNLLKLFAM